MFLTHLPPIEQGQTRLARPFHERLFGKAAARIQVLDSETAASYRTGVGTHALQEHLSLVPKVLGWKPGWGEQFPLVFLRLGENLPGKPRPGLRYQGWSWVPHLGRNWQYLGFPRDITHGLETLATTLATNLSSSWALSDLASDYSTLYKQCCLGLHHLLNFLS